MFSDGPPSRDEVTTSLTWADSTDVKHLDELGMIAPASVPHGDDRRELPPHRAVAEIRNQQRTTRRR
jgi:hypothetical protein